MKRIDLQRADRKAKDQQHKHRSPAPAAAADSSGDSKPGTIQGDGIRIRSSTQAPAPGGGHVQRVNDRSYQLKKSENARQRHNAKQESKKTDRGAPEFSKGTVSHIKGLRCSRAQNFTRHQKIFFGRVGRLGVSDRVEI